MHVVYPGVAGDFCALQRRAGDGKTILTVGTVERRKNLDALVRLLPDLAGARIVSVGPPTAYQNECAALAESLGVAHRVEFRGYVDRARTSGVIRYVCLVAVPSHYEGFGYAAAQALCCGAPCIVSDQGALPEIVAGDAPVAAVGDAPAWTKALAFALRGDDDARAASIRERAIGRLSWPSSARKMKEVYRSALGTPVSL